MANVLKASVQIRGLRPLLWHRFGPDSIPLEKKEKSGVAGNDPTEWKSTVLFNKERQLYLEPSYIFGCVRDGAKFTKKGKGSIQSTVAATLQVIDDRILIADRFLPEEKDLTQDPDAPVYLDVRSVKNPATKGRNVRYRIAASPGWVLNFNVSFDKTMVSRSELEAVTLDAGRFVGLGDGRSIGFGRFEVLSFDVSDLK